MLVQGQCGLRSGHFYAFLTSESDSKMQNTLYKFCAIHWSSGMIQKTGVNDASTIEFCIHAKYGFILFEENKAHLSEI